MTRLADGVHFVGTVGNPPVISTYLVGGDGEYALVEPGPSSTADQTLELIQAIGLPLSSIKFVVATHVHLDHAGGAWKILERLPNATVVAYKGGGKHIADPRRLLEGAEMVLGPLYRLWGEMKPVPADRIQEMVDGEVLPVGGRRLKALYSPGHSPFHMSLLELESRSLFTGDALGMYVEDRSTLWPASPLPSFRYEECMDTIGELEAEAPRRLLIPHYGPQGDVPRLFELNKKTYRAWHDLLGREPAQKGIADVVSDIIGSDPSYAWVPADELTKWVVTMHATGFRKYFTDRNKAS